MPRIILILATFLLAMVARADQSTVGTPKKLRDRVGFTELKQKYPGLDGTGIRIGLLDRFRGLKKEKGATPLLHGHMVEQGVKWFAPKAEILRKDKGDDFDIKPSDGLHILNISTHLGIQEATELARSGTILVYAGVNDSEIVGRDNARIHDGMATNANYIYEIAKKINDDPTIPGAVIVVGSGVPKNQNKQDEGLSLYSNMAGITRDWFLFARSSRMADTLHFEQPALAKIKKGFDAGDDLLGEREDILRSQRTSSQLVEIGLYEGTSFAAPAVCGMLALGMQAFPDVPAKEIAKLFLKTSRLEYNSVPELIQRRLFNSTSLSVSEIKGLSPQDIYGHGEIDLRAFFQEAEAKWKAYEISKNGWLRQGKWALRTHVLLPDLPASLRVSASRFDDKNNDVILKSTAIASGKILNEMIEKGNNVLASKLNKALKEGEHTRKALPN